MVGKSIVAALILLFMTETALSKDILITNDTGTQGKGKLLIEVNNEFASDEESVAGVSVKQTESELGSIVSYGLVENVDLIFVLPYIWNKVEEAGAVIQKVNGISDIAAEAKWRFYETDTLSVALKPGISIPTGDEDKGLGTGKAGYNVFFIATKQIEPVTFNLNLAYFRNENDARERKDIWYASLSTEYAVRENMRLIMNAGIERNPEKGAGSHPAFLLAGVNCSLTGNFDINLGIKAGLNDTEADRTLLTGIAAKF